MSGSLADRITTPASAAPSVTPEPSISESSTARNPLDTMNKSWADELTSPTEPAPTTDLGDAQLDGSVSERNGSKLEEGDYEVEITLNELQQDSSSDNPLFSLNKTFESLIPDARLLRAISEMNFKKPSKVQASALPYLLGAKPVNMIAQSQSGTGKTATFVLTILSKIDYKLPMQPQALILAPTRELARQIEGVIRTIGKYISQLTVHAAVPGNTERGKPLAAMVIVGTPGTVNDLIKRRLFDVSQLKIICLDEADTMMEQQGLGDQCMRIRNQIPGVNSKVTQVLLFSATFPEDVIPFAKRFCPNPIELRLQKSELNVKGISQMFIDCPEGEGKYEVLIKLYGLMNIGSSIIFVKERRHADQIASRMLREGHAIAHIHGAFEAGDRDRILEQFRKGEAKVLITTNVLARGIDVSTVSMVINYDIPMLPDGRNPDLETYIHRIGRTGRFGRVGVSISFVNDRTSFQALKTISDQYQISLIQLSVTDWNETEEVVQRVIKSSRAAGNIK